jgi:hypothetical protein
MKVSELKYILSQYNDDDEVMKVDPTGQGVIIPGRVELRHIHVYEFRNDESPMSWYTTERQTDIPPYKYVIREFDGAQIQFV